MEIPHKFFLSTPRNSTSFLIDPWHFHMLIPQYPWKVHALSSTPVPYNDSKDELKKHQNKKDLLLQSKDSYNYSIEQPEGHAGTASAYRIKKISCLKMI